MTIPLARPWFDLDEETAVLDVLRSGWVAQGRHVASFERDFGVYVQTPHALAVSSGTSALHLAMLAARLAPGDEVLVPAFTWISTPNAVEYVGARAVFCDVDRSTLNIDVSDAERRITSRTRAIVVVHQFGLAADMPSLMKLAEKHGLLVIEDAACSLGAYSHGRHTGTIGEIGCFSFHPRKSITTGEGGMVVMASLEKRSVVASLRDIGADREGQSAESIAQGLLPDFKTLGYNFRLTDLQGAIGTAQLKKFPEILRRRRVAAKRYDERIAGSGLAEWLGSPPGDRGNEHSYQAYVCRVLVKSGDASDIRTAHERRNRLMMELGKLGIKTRPGTHAPHTLTYYREKYGLRPEECPRAWEADRLTIALPLHPHLSESDREQVCEALERLWPTLVP